MYQSVPVVYDLTLPLVHQLLFGSSWIRDGSQLSATTENIHARQPFQFDENTDLASLSEHELFTLTQNLKDEESSKRPLIGSIETLSTLREEYIKGNQTVVRKIDWLEGQGWKALRRARGDGDCFYRSLAFAYVERLMDAKEVDLAVAFAQSVLERSLNLLELAGFDKIAYEDFYETLVELIERITKPKSSGQQLTKDGLVEFFQNPESSNSVVVFMRLLTSAQIRADPDAFEPFLFHPDTYEQITIRDFCEKFVDATGKEADHPQMTALSRALSFGVHVAYLDGSASNTSADSVDFVKFEPEGSEYNGTQPVVLLYRPGHYDILEPKETKST